MLAGGLQIQRSGGKHNITNVIDFGKAFTLGNKEFDLLLNSGLFIELKNCDFVAQGLNAQKIDQLIQGYFKNISSLDDMKWVAAHRKLKDYNLWATIPQAETKMREMWKNAFLTKHNPTDNNLELFNVIWDNQNLRNSLFGNVDEFDTVIKSQKINQLTSWINDINSPFYNFIKVE